MSFATIAILFIAAVAFNHEISTDPFCCSTARAANKTQEWDYTSVADCILLTVELHVTCVFAGQGSAVPL